MRIQKIIFPIFLSLILIKETHAGITTSASFGFGRYRNQNAPKESAQPVGWTWGLGLGYRYDMAAIEGVFFKYSGCAENESHFTKYDTCASDRLYGVLGRLYFQDSIDIIFGYAQHVIKHRVEPSNEVAARDYHYDTTNENGGIAYGLGGKLNIATGYEAFFDVIILAIGNKGNRAASEIDLFVGGIKADF